MPDNKVHIELVADDKAQESLKRVTEQLHKMEEARKKATGEAEGGKEGEGGFGLKEAFEIEGVREFADKLKEVVGELVKAGTEQDRVTRSIAGMLAVTDRTGQSYDSLLGKAGLFEESMHDTALESGVMQEKVTNAFNIILERSGKSAQASAELTKQMAIASAAVPGGIEAMSFGFAQMSSGFVHARNPIVQLIASTGTLKGNALAVTKALQGMTAEQRNEKAIEAISKMSEKMEHAAPSFDSVVTSLHTFKEGMIEDVGSGLLRDLTPKLNGVLQDLLGNKEKIERAARDFGHWLSGEFDIVWDGMNRAFKEAKQDASGILEYYKTAGKTIAEGMAQALIWSGQIAHKFSDAWNGGKLLVAQFGDAMAHLGGGNATYVEQLHRENTAKVFEDTGLKAYATWYGNTPEMMERVNALRKTNYDVNQYYADPKHLAEVQQQAGALYKQSEAEATKYGFRQSGGYLTHAAEIQAGSEDAVEDFAKTMQHAQGDHNEAMERYGAGIIIANEKFADTLIKAGDKTGIAWDHVIQNLKDLEGVIPGITKESVENLQKKLMGSPGTAGQGPIFNIGTMNINQSFVDQDPDRVAVIFQKDLAKAALNRTQAMLSPSYSP